MKKYKRGQLILFSKNNRNFIGCVLYLKDKEFRVLRDDNRVFKISEGEINEKLEIMENLNYLSLFLNTVSDNMLHKALELEKSNKNKSLDNMIKTGKFIDQYPILGIQNELNYILKYCQNYMLKQNSTSYYFFRSKLYRQEKSAFIEIVDLSKRGKINEIYIESIPQFTEITNRIF